MKGTPQAPLDNITAKANHRGNLRGWVFVVGLLLSFLGVATASHYLTFTGVFAIAVTVRYRKTPAFWFCLATLVLALVAAAIVRPNWPLAAAIPLMLSYVFDYIDEKIQRRTVDADATATVGASRHGNLTEPGAPQSGGPPSVN